MKKFIESKVLSINKINDIIFEFECEVGDIVSQCKNGQFCSIYVNSNANILPRPISISEIDIHKKAVKFVVAIVGEGTKLLSNIKVGEKVTMIAPIGNGFNINENKKNVYLIGGGVGIPPLVELYKNLKSKSPFNIKVILGFKGDNIFLTNKFDKEDLVICTEDGTVGFKGNVVQYLEENEDIADIIYSCGPTPMLKNIVSYANKKGITTQISMEERMACSVGACLGCVIKVKSNKDYEYKKVCVDGPVFDGKEVIFE